MLHVALLHHIVKAVQGDALGDAGRRKHGAVAVELNAGQNGSGLPAARAWQLGDDLQTAAQRFSTQSHWLAVNRDCLGYPGSLQLAAVCA